MNLPKNIEAFSARIGHCFSRPELLIEALTHSSTSSPAGLDNQRLEFLGDRVLALAVADALHTADRDADEGHLAPRMNALVRRETCAEVARQTNLGAALKLGRSEVMSGGRRKEALLADAMEAVIAAIYLDAGYETAKEAVLRLWGDRIHQVKTDERDAKTALQEWAQSQGQLPPAYSLIGREGPDHAPRFTVEARLADGRTAAASAGAKRQAEQDAAHMLLSELEGSRS